MRRFTHAELAPNPGLNRRRPGPVETVEKKGARRMYLKRSTRSVDEVFAGIEAAARMEGFGVLHHYDFKQILAGKGVPIDRECRVMEVCNPRQAKEVLSADMSLNLALPCRLSIYEGNDGGTVVGMIPPTEMLALVSNDPRVAEVARSVEKAMERIVDAVV